MSEQRPEPGELWELVSMGSPTGFIIQTTERPETQILVANRTGLHGYRVGMRGGWSPHSPNWKLVGSADPNKEIIIETFL